MAKSDAFIKIGDLKGESQDSKHQDWIDVLSWNWGMSNTGSGQRGGGSGTGKGDVQDFHFTKTVDTSSTYLGQRLMRGDHFPKATFELRKAGGESTPLVYYKVEFETVFISGMSFGGGGEGGAFSESITFNFKKFKATYTKQSSTGTADGQSTLGWDVAMHQEVS